MVGAEFTTQGKRGDYSSNLSNIETGTATKLSLGGYFIPKYNSFSGYFKRVTYRAGYII